MKKLLWFSKLMIIIRKKVNDRKVILPNTDRTVMNLYQKFVQILFDHGEFYFHMWKLLKKIPHFLKVYVWYISKSNFPHVEISLPKVWKITDVWKRVVAKAFNIIFTHMLQAHCHYIYYFHYICSLYMAFILKKNKLI